jgi:nucleoside-triphosphatase THEP1
LSVSGIVLWVGPKHSGKTTSATEMVENLRTGGHSVGGILAPSLYRDGRLVGFDIVDVLSGRRGPLLRLGRPGDVGPFVFEAEGVGLAQSALASSYCRQSDLIVIDEFGPLELAGRGWRDAVDRLVKANDSLLLLVVRQSLITTVSELYTSHSVHILPADVPGSTAHIDQILSQRAGMSCYVSGPRS